MNEEILAGLKTATEHSSSLEEATQSFINAGYNPNEVRETANFFSRGFSPLPNIVKEENIQKEKTIPQEELPIPPKKQASKTTLWIILTLVAIVIIGIVISLLLFKDKFLGTGLTIIDSIFP